MGKDSRRVPVGEKEIPSSPRCALRPIRVKQPLEFVEYEVGQKFGVNVEGVIKRAYAIHMKPY